MLHLRVFRKIIFHRYRDQFLLILPEHRALFPFPESINERTSVVGRVPAVRTYTRGTEFSVCLVTGGGGRRQQIFHRALIAIGWVWLSLREYSSRYAVTGRRWAGDGDDGVRSGQRRSGTRSGAACG